MTVGVYRIAHAATARFYIGSSNNCERRFVEHLSGLRNGRHHNRHLQAIFNKHGEPSLSFEVLESFACQDDALDCEQALLDRLYGLEGCINGTRQARMPLHDPDVRARSIAAMRASERYKAAHREVCLKRNADPEFQRRAHAAALASATWQAALVQRAERLKEPEIVARNREALRNSKAQKAAAHERARLNHADPAIKARMLAATSVKVVGVNVVTGERLSFPSQSAAARALGVRSSNISQACSGLLGVIKGYRWAKAME
jgi:group I intron endonuclease